MHRILLLVLIALAPFAAYGQEFTSMYYAVVEGNSSTRAVSISIGQGTPPQKAAIHMYGVPSSHFVSGNVVAAATSGREYLRRVYVLGVPPRLRVTDLETGEVRTVEFGQPAVVLQAPIVQTFQWGAGVVFPDAFYAGFVGNPGSYPGDWWFAGATIGHNVTVPSRATTYSSYTVPAEVTYGLSPMGSILYDSPDHYGNSPAAGGRPGAAWVGQGGTPIPRFIQFHVTYATGTGGTEVQGIRDHNRHYIPVRYAIGY